MSSQLKQGIVGTKKKNTTSKPLAKLWNKCLSNKSDYFNLATLVFKNAISKCVFKGHYEDFDLSIACVLHYMAQLCTFCFFL